VYRRAQQLQGASLGSAMGGDRLAALASTKGIDMKRILGVALAAVLTFGVLTLAEGSTAAASPGPSATRSGAMHVSKECSQYTGAAGSFCTITASNVPAIKVGAKVVYLSAANPDGTLDSDIVVRNGHGNRLFGHVWLNATTMTIRFHGGTGVFRHFRGHVAVSVTDAGTPNELWHWDGWYTFGSCRHGSARG
jgi:hypothetical protein